MTILTGLFRITRDAELRYLPSGEPVINLSLVYSYGTKKNEHGFLPSQFVEAGLWGKRAESLAQYLTKSKRIWAVITDVHIEAYKKQDGSPGHKLAGRVQEIQFADEKQQDGQSAEPGEAAPRPTSRPARQAAPAAPTKSGFDDMDDDIPF